MDFTVLFFRLMPELPLDLHTFRSGTSMQTQRRRFRLMGSLRTLRTNSWEQFQSCVHLPFRCAAAAEAVTNG